MFTATRVIRTARVVAGAAARVLAAVGVVAAPAGVATSAGVGGRGVVGRARVDRSVDRGVVGAAATSAACGRVVGGADVTRVVDAHRFADVAHLVGRGPARVDAGRRRLVQVVLGVGQRLAVGG